MHGAEEQPENVLKGNWVGRYKYPFFHHPFKPSTSLFLSKKSFISSAMAIMIFLATLLVIFVSSFAKIAYDTLSFYWLTPRRIRKRMAEQGVYGPNPRPFTGNILDVVELVKESTANDMSSISHDIVDRLLPYYSAWTKQYGTTNTFILFKRVHDSLVRRLRWRYLDLELWLQ